jgi:hypothetical protein
MKVIWPNLLRFEVDGILVLGGMHPEVAEFFKQANKGYSHTVKN